MEDFKYEDKAGWRKRRQWGDSKHRVIWSDGQRL